VMSAFAMPGRARSAAVATPASTPVRALRVVLLRINVRSFMDWLSRTRTRCSGVYSRRSFPLRAPLPIF